MFLWKPRIQSIINSTNEQTFPKTLARGLLSELTFLVDQHGYLSLRNDMLIVPVPC